MSRRPNPADESDTASGEGLLAQRLASARELLRGLLDIEFRQLLTPRMLPTLYLIGIGASAYAVLAYAAEGFAQSTGLGLMRLLLVGPVAFVVLVILLRVALELCIALFRIALHVNELAGHAEDIADGLPRISFWKPRRKRGE
ncbi:MAG TPA: DUF4282 domain-containing protein [Solimonas sp.]|nr:DUF4282 domain-containing protein [Solimonas sp.]